jgi:hypothetical protein
MMLVQIARDSCVINDKANIFTFNRDQRAKLVEDVFNQQNRGLVELEVDDLVPLHERQEGTSPELKGDNQ